MPYKKKLIEVALPLEAVNRESARKWIDRIGSETPTQILYLTHRQDKMPRCITNVLRLAPDRWRQLHLDSPDS